MDDRCGVDFGDSQQDAIAKLLPGLHPDVPKKGARNLAEKGLHDIEPRSMLWRQHVLKAIGTSSQEGSSLFRNMRGMVIQPQRSPKTGQWWSPENRPIET